MNKTLNQDQMKEKIEEILKYFVYLQKTNEEVTQSLLTLFQEEMKNIVRLNLTDNISHCKFIDGGKKEWQVLPGRGVEPCLECGNGFKIRKLITLLFPKPIKEPIK